MPETASPVFRLDSFTVPESARGEFLHRVHATHKILREQKGFVLDRIIERTLGNGKLRLITLVEWSGSDAIADAVRAVKLAHAGDGFSVADFITRSGIAADIGMYQPVQEQP